eukprot:4338454-Prymnesium_polylepis.1
MVYRSVGLPSRKWHGDGNGMEMDPSPCHFRLAQLAAAPLAAFTSGTASEASRGQPFPVGWKRGTLAAIYAAARGATG